MNKRWVVLNRDKHGNMSLTFAAQGRYTYATADEAYAALRDIVQNNPESRIREVWGSQAIGTFGIRCVECWPGHNDPVATVYEALAGEGE